MESLMATDGVRVFRSTANHNAECGGCGFSHNSYSNATRMAVRRHVAKTGHAVTVITKQMATYEPEAMSSQRTT